jgi:hypothetical protein
MIALLSVTLNRLATYFFCVELDRKAACCVELDRLAVLCMEWTG